LVMETKQEILEGDCVDKLKDLKDNSVDAVVTDPPYGLGFMGKEWDTFDKPRYSTDGLYDFTKDWATECLRVLKPGGYLLSFAGTRTQHKIAMGIEDAGFEIRDMIAWVYGSGFPKSLNIGKAVDKLQGNERIVVGVSKNDRPNSQVKGGKAFDRAMDNGQEHETILETKGTSEWEGWGTALKPAVEPIVVARKPLSEKTVALNVLKWGTGGINIDGCRVEGKLDGDPNRFAKTDGGWGVAKFHEAPIVRSEGRFPANLIHDGSDEVVSLFPNTKSGGGNRNSKGKTDLFTGFGDTGVERSFPSSEGSASRFFYCAKASKSERNKGCEELEEKIGENGNKWTDQDYRRGDEKPTTARKNFHPTVKPIALMQYLVKLVSREGATVLDPFAGSFSTGIACINLNRNFIGIERDEEYVKIGKARMSHAKKNKPNPFF